MALSVWPFDWVWYLKGRLNRTWIGQEAAPMIQEGDRMGPGSELEGSGEKGREKALHFPFCELLLG